MISAQTLRVCREEKPVSTFPDHALEPGGCYDSRWQMARRTDDGAIDASAVREVLIEARNQTVAAATIVRSQANCLNVGNKR
jgi:hypothetical protein